MPERILNFLKHNNAVPLIAMFLFMGTTATYAATSPVVKGSILSTSQTVRSVDNTYLVAANLDNFDSELRVTQVTEDDSIYYVSYVYSTMEVQEYVWKKIEKTGRMTVSKKELDTKDLGLYVAEQLGQVVSQQVAYLKDVQNQERKKGSTNKIVSTEYSGLVGQFLDSTEQTFPGYDPVKSPVVVATSTAVAMQSVVNNESEVSERVGDAVRKLLAEQKLATQKAAAEAAKSQPPVTAPAEPSPVTPPVVEPPVIETPVPPVVEPVVPVVPVEPMVPPPAETPTPPVEPAVPPAAPVEPVAPPAETPTTPVEPVAPPPAETPAQ